MQVFVPYVEPYFVAQTLDKRRLNKQVLECRQIIKAITSESEAWKNHPVVNMYKNHMIWLIFYTMCLDAYRKGHLKEAWRYSQTSCRYTPPFLKDERVSAHHRERLYTKNPEYYRRRWPHFTNYDYSKCEENLYIVDGKTLWYKNGKLVNVGTFPDDFYGKHTWSCMEEIKGCF